MDSKSIPVLLDEHQAMLHAVQQLRLALLEGEIAAARQALHTLQALHAAHIAAEEAQWIAQLSPSARWQPKVYLAEHAKLAEMMQTWQHRLDALSANTLDAVARLHALDASLPLQHLLEHHFEREEKGLFVELQQ